MLERSLAGEWKLVMHVSQAGRATCYLLHLPSTRSSYGNKLMAKFDLMLTDEEMLDGDWVGLIERCANGAAFGL